MFKIFTKKSKGGNIAIVRLSGVIGKVSFSSGLSLSGLKYLEKIAKIKNLKAIALLINSPGGSPVQSELISKKIKAIAKKHKDKPVILSFCEDVAASGGYWLACIGQEIYASSSSIVGSIGVVSQGFGFSKAIKKLGIERRVHTQGDNKSILDPFSEEKEKDIELIKNIQKDIHQTFIDYVKLARGKKIKLADKDVFNGKIFSGSKAKEIGLIDDIGFFEEVLYKKYGTKVKFKEISVPKSFLQRKFSAMIESILHKIVSNIEESRFYLK